MNSRARLSGVAVVATGRLHQPGVGLDGVSVDAGAIGQTGGETDLAEGMAGPGCGSVGGGGTRQVNRSATAILKHDAEIVLGDSQPLVGCPAIEGDGPLRVTRDTQSLLVHVGKVVVGFRESRRGRLVVPGKGLLEAGSVAGVGRRKASQAILCLRQALAGGEMIPVDGEIGLRSTMDAALVEACEALLGAWKVKVGGAGEKIDGRSRVRLLRLQHVMGQGYQRRRQSPVCRLAVPVDGAFDVDGAQEARFMEPGQVVLDIDIAVGGTLRPRSVGIRVAPFRNRLPSGNKSGIFRPGGSRQDQACGEKETGDRHGPSIGVRPC